MIEVMDGIARLSALEEDLARMAEHQRAHTDRIGVDINSIDRVMTENNAHVAETADAANASRRKPPE